MEQCLSQSQIHFGWIQIPINSPLNLKLKAQGKLAVTVKTHTVFREPKIRTSR